MQTLSNTPSRFVRDVETLAHSVGGATDVGRKYPTGDQPPRWVRGIHAAAVWPVDVGWFYLEYTQRLKEHPGSIKYGLLTRGPLLTSEPVEPFFDAVEHERPTVQDRWPQRALIATPTHSGSQPTRTEAVDQRVRTWPDESQPRLPIHGSNPLYATAAEDIDTASERPPGTLYDPLCRTSTLLYDPGTSLTRDGGLQLKHLYGVRPPTANSLYVCALGG